MGICWKCEEEIDDGLCDRCAREEREKKDRRIAELEAFRGRVVALIAESHGVAGLHLNGDVAPWDSLAAGGQFEGWLGEIPE